MALQTLAELQTFRSTLEDALEEQVKAAGEWEIEGASYDREAALKGTRSVLAWVERRIAVLESGASTVPQRLGIDTGDLSDG